MNENPINPEADAKEASVEPAGTEANQHESEKGKLQDEKAQGRPDPAPGTPGTEQPKENTQEPENQSETSISVADTPSPPPAVSEDEFRVNGGRLLDELRDTITRYVVLPEDGAETLALWILHTHAFHLRMVTTYIGIASPEKRCGKSTLLGVLSELVARPVIAANISSSAFFRVIEEKRPTLLIDEADTFLDANEEMRGILNSGYSKKTAYVVRVANRMQGDEDSSDRKATKGRNKEGMPRLGVWGKGTPAEDPITPALSRGGAEIVRSGSQLAQFSTWCPKAIAAIGRLPETLADRCIVITMQRKRSSEKCERLKNLSGAYLKLQCERFAQQNAQQIGWRRPQVPSSLNDRAADIWEPLLVLADLAGGSWPEAARKAAVHFSGVAQESASVSSLLIRDLRVLFYKSGVERMFSRDIVSVLKNVRERPWNEGRKPATEMWLSMQLRPYGILPKALRIGQEMARGYERTDFAEVFARYANEEEPKELGEFEKLQQAKKAGELTRLDELRPD